MRERFFGLRQFFKSARAVVSFSELYTIYPLIKISMERMQNLAFLR